MKVAIGSDHAGLDLKEELKRFLTEQEIPFEDFGTHSPEPFDYPDAAVGVAEAVASGEYNCGILICATGIGMSIAANKVKGIRAALCHDTYSAKVARTHNDSNILAIGGLIIDFKLACEIVKIWLNTDFSNAERHIRRIGKITKIEEKYTGGAN